MSATDDLLRNAEAYEHPADASGRPAKRVAVLACMDARLAPMKLLGLREGDAHVIRNAGGVASDDAIRSLAISQSVLGTEEVVVIQHTACGMLTPEDELKRALGGEPPWPLHTFSDLEASVRDSVAKIRESAFIPSKGSIRGFVYEVETGRLREVT